MPSTVPCPSCGAEVHAGATRCGSCGAEIMEQTVRLSADELSAVSSPGAGGAKEAAELAALTDDVSATLAPRFQSVRLLGQGGMGIVYLARDPGLKRDVAVKVLAPDAAADADAHKRFIREAQAAAAVAHPNVVTIHQVGELTTSGAPYFVMQYVEGRTLEQEFPRGTPAAEPTARRIVAEIAAALGAAHERGVVHRDIKPSNIMLDPVSGRAIVVDFGISAAVVPQAGARDTRLTAQGVSIGTPQYMSPEQAVGDEVGGKSDVYSLGLVAFELLTGRPVFEERSAMALIAAHINTDPPRLSELRPGLDPAFADVVQRCLVKQPADRPTAQEVAQVLHPIQARIEWPPPGLERLHRKGVELLTAARMQSGVAVALLALLYLQPAMTTGLWAGGETSWFWRVVWAPGFWGDGIFLRPLECNIRESMNLACPPPMVDAGPLWLFTISVLVAVQIFGLGRIVRRTLALRHGMGEGRALGYPAQVLSEAAWDATDDTGALLEGVGPFALTSEAERSGLRERRRTATVARLAGYGVAALMPVFWVFGIVRLGDSSARMVALPELLLSITPLLAMFAWRSRLLAPERMLTQRWKRKSIGRAKAERVPKPLVDGWLESGKGLLAGADPRRAPLTPLIWLQAAAAVLVVGAAGLMFGGAHFSALWNGPTVRLMQQDLVDSRTGALRATWGWLDSALETESKRIAGTIDRGRVVPATTRPQQALRKSLGYYRADSGGVDSSLARLARDTSWRWRDKWREALVAAQWTPNSAVTPRPIFPYGPNAVGRRARESAVLAFEAGDRGTARARVREALQFARFVVALGTWWPFQSASDVEEALNLHGALSAAVADTLGVRTAELLRERFDRYRWANRLFVVTPMPLTLATDPENPLLVQLVSRSGQMAPGSRRQLALVSVLGLCFNSREVLFGPSAARWRLVEEVRTAVGDMPVVVRQLDSLTAEMKRGVAERPGLIRMFSRWGAVCDLNKLSKLE